MSNEEISHTAEAGNGSTNPVMTTPNRPVSTPSLAQECPNRTGFWAQIRPHFDLVSKLVPIVWSIFCLPEAEFPCLLLGYAVHA